MAEVGNMERTERKTQIIPDAPIKIEGGRTLAERHPDWPKVTIMTFYFSPHNTAEEMAGMKAHMHDVDIYFYENARGNENTTFLQTLANAYPDPERLDRFLEQRKGLQGTALESIMRSLYGSRVIVGHMDLRPEDPVTWEDIDENLKKPYLDMDFDTSLQNLKEKFTESARLQNERRKIMVSRFEEELEEIMAAHPELKQKKELKILATLGPNNTPISRELQKDGIEIDRKFSSMPYPYDYVDQVEREIMSGREPSRDILAKAYLSNIITAGVGGVMEETVHGDQLSRYTRALASKFETSEIEAIHEMSKKGLTLEKIDELLHAKGLGKLPRSKDQLNNYLSESSVHA